MAEGHSSSATVFWQNFKSKVADQACLLPLHPSPLQLLPAPFCSWGCGNLAPVPSPSPQSCYPLFPHTSCAWLPRLGQFVQRQAHYVSMCSQPAHARVINTRFAVLIWVPFKLKAACCSVPACLARGNWVALASCKLEATHAQVRTACRLCEKHDTWGSWPKGRRTARATTVIPLEGGCSCHTGRARKGKVGRKERTR